jgi:hypothetical protein
VGTVGTKTLKVEAQSDNYDPAPVNNAVTADVPIAAATTSSTTGGSSSGGGALDWLLLAALAGLKRIRKPAPAPASE